MCGLKDYSEVCNHRAYELYCSNYHEEYEPSEYEKQCEYIDELEKTLKECNHCKGEVALLWSSRTTIDPVDRYAAECQECGMSTPLCKLPEEAVEIWNTRHEKLVTL